jgi:RNase H-like protein
MLSRTLRQRIGGLLREGFLPGLEPRRHFVSTGIEEILPGGLVETEHGPVFAHERLYTDLGERPVPLLRRFADLCVYPGCELDGTGIDDGPRYVEVPGVDCPYPPDRIHARRRPRDLPEAVGLYDPPERGLFRRFGHRRVLYMDIETCGLSAAPVFLVGLCMVADRNLVLRQLFARDYAEEKALLAEVRRIAGEHDFLVTFNGKAFDVPFLRDRAVHHRLATPIEMPHLDLLWMARRRWKDILPDCKLKTIEWRVLRRRRAGDVGGSEIPGLYHDYVKRGEAHRLLPVFHHNLLDVVAMVELTPVIFDPDVTVY